jgi:predicted enzyme related to lactoylglutathione lyase
MANPVTQFQILSKAPNETAKFYSTLFGWAVNDNNPLGYREINTGSALIADARAGSTGAGCPAESVRHCILGRSRPGQSSRSQRRTETH